MKRNPVTTFLTHAALLALSFFALYPVLLMVLGSFKHAWDLAANPAGLPTEFTFRNYGRLISFNSGIMARTYLNSVFVAIS